MRLLQLSVCMLIFCCGCATARSSHADASYDDTSYDGSNGAGSDEHPRHARHAHKKAARTRAEGHAQRSTTASAGQLRAAGPASAASWPVANYQSGSWYLCDDPAGYYPYVAACRTQWRQVAAWPSR